MRKALLLTTTLLIVFSAKAQLRTKVYISYLGTDSISCIDGNSRTFSKPLTINTEGAPIMFDIQGDSSMFIIDNYNNNLFQYNTVNNTNIKAKGMPHRIKHLKYNTSHSYLYYSNKYKFFKINTTTLTVIDSFKFLEFNGHYYDVNFVFINDSIIFYNGGPKAYKYNLNTRQNIDSMDGYTPGTYQYLDDKIYSSKLDTLIIIDVNLMQVTDSIKMNAHMGVLPARSVHYNGRLYFSSYSVGGNRQHFIETFEPDSKKFSASVMVEHSSKVYISPDGDIWMIDYLDKKVYVYSIAEKKIIDVISVGRMPDAIMFARGYNHKSSIGAVNGIINLKLYPNPANDKITLETGYNEVKNYTVINSLGKTIMSFKSEGQKTEVDVSNLPTGVYFVIPDGDKTKAIKFIKQ